MNVAEFLIQDFWFKNLNLNFCYVVEQNNRKNEKYF